ncbi:MAG: DUF177 domain-containing protein, partial [Firmicutes bacterium]|nr:DUF177 domain-containing protein [Bacillota bacterium]
GVPCSTHTSGTAVHTEEGYVISGKVEAVLSLVCDRCLDTFSRTIVCPLDEVYSNDINEEKEYRSYEDKVLDLKDAVTGAVMLELPLKVLCSEDCRGLCIKCGQNLNKGECGCDRGYINPAFDGLMDLFK